MTSPFQSIVAIIFLTWVSGSATMQAPFIPYSISAYDSIPSCTLNTTNEIDSSSFHFHVQVRLQGRNCSMGTVAIIDSGAMALFLDYSFIKKIVVNR